MHQHDTDDPAAFWERHYSSSDRIWSGRANPVLAATVADLPPGRALDLGCGEGGDAVHLAAAGWQVTAVDVSATALARTREHAAAAGVADAVATERHDLADYSPAGEFDLVSAQFLQSPLEFERASVLRRAADALVVGGLLLVVDHGSAPSWGWRHDHHVEFPSPAELYEGLGLDEARFRPERLESPERDAVGPDGEAGRITDTVVAVRRIA
ncbi:class I SAM-dependent methyltransferase [Glycomyces paridis]|uniref:Methyltransferase domain-containing protein n=1 Tax=Glycomyces paridis TaxID=2126555 RepID=A0A4V4HPQ8_9ACTN|nr:methyltransferase domain-containing protein [Glycomyces paridis]THV30836.1 methyltransferase domain-containing protein [Glycomyces paridis]